MADIFQNGAFFMGFDMDPTAAQIFTQSNHGSASASTPYSFGFSWSTGGNTAGILFNTNLITVIVGFAVNIQTSASNTTICNFVDATAGAVQVSLQFTSTGALQFYRGGTAIGPASAAGTFTVSTWYYIECLVTISGTVGVVQCNVNGGNVIANTGSLNTQNTANTWVNAFSFQGFNASFFDDWYMLDTTGASPLNTYLGPVQVRGDAPNANSAVGGRNAWTPTNPTNVNHSNVANIPANAAEYNADSTVGDYDMFQFPSLPSNTGKIFAVDEWALTLIDSSGARTIGLNCYSGGTDSLGTAFTPGVSAGYTNLLSAVDPNTSSAWTVSNAQAAELGVKVIS